MAKRTNTTNRRNNRTTPAERAVKTQKTINNDYKELAEDYRRLGMQLWKIPATKYILAGAALASLVPVTMRLFRRYPQINEFIHENLDTVEGKVTELKDKVTERISRASGDEEFTDVLG